MIKVSGTGEPIAYEVTNPCGYLNHLFTHPAHRSKGLGTAVEKELCVKLIKKGIAPSKDVSMRGGIAVRLSEKSPYWTRWEDSEGNPVVMKFHHIIQRETS